MPATKTYVDRTLEKALREKGLTVHLCWEVPGPKHTGIAWMSMFAVTNENSLTRLVMVQTFANGGYSYYVEGQGGLQTADCVKDIESRL